MIDKRQTLFEAITTFTAEHFSDRDHFVCIYGSYASGHYRESSDIDLFVALKYHDRREFELLRDFVQDLHLRHGLPLDDEVPYENKLVASYDDIRDAIGLKAFTQDGERYSVAPIEKRPEFLASREVRLRLILNALTTPHLCLSGNNQLYSEFRISAESALMTLAKGLLIEEDMSPEQILNVLLKGENGERGELYLGYKEERTETIAYLRDLVARHSNS
jgi:predicted nucleotidyltransferase